MTFLLDQDVPEPIARIIQQAGHKLWRLREVLPSDSPDDAGLAAAEARQAILVTCNRNDFLALAESKSHFGLAIVVRRQTRVAEAGKFLRLLQNAGETGLRNNINFA